MHVQQLLVALLLLAAASASRGDASCSAGGQPSAAAAAMPFGAFDFEVHGRVQGVFFRQHTVDKAQALGLTGWCANTARGTVAGAAQGTPAALQQMKDWLSTEGSPQSRIERCEVRNERSLQQLEFAAFVRRPNVA